MLASFASTKVGGNFCSKGTKNGGEFRPRQSRHATSSSLCKGRARMRRPKFSSWSCAPAGRASFGKPPSASAPAPAFSIQAAANEPPNGFAQKSGKWAERFRTIAVRQPESSSPVERPAVAIGPAQIFVGFRAIRHLTRGAVVTDLFARTISYQAQQHHFRHVAAVLEIAAGLALAFAGVDPLPLEIAHGREQFLFRARFVIGHIALPAERVNRPGVEVADQHALGAFEHGS